MSNLRRRTIMDNRPTIVWNQLFKVPYTKESGSVGNFRIVNNGGSASVFSIGENDLTNKWWSIRSHNKINITKDHVYYCRLNCNPTKSKQGCLLSGGRTAIIGAVTLKNNEQNILSFFNKSTTTVNYSAFLYLNNKESNIYADGELMLEIKNYSVFDLTQMFGEGNEPTSVAQFQQWFIDNIGPLDTYYPYNAGQEIKVKYLPKNM